MDIDSVLTAEGEKWRASHQQDPQAARCDGSSVGEATRLADAPHPVLVGRRSLRRGWVMTASAAAVAAITASAVLIARPPAGPAIAQQVPVVSSSATGGGPVRLPGDLLATLVGQEQLPRSFSPDSGYQLGPKSLINPGGDPHYPKALTQLDALLASVPLLDGATESAGPTAPALALPQSTPGSFELITRTRWFITNRTPAEVLDAAAAWKGNAATSSGGVNGVKVLNLGWPVPDLGSAQALDNVQLAVGVIAVEGGTAVRLDVQGDWVRTRPANSMIPAGMTSLSVTINRRGRSPVHGNITGSDATAIVTLLNQQQVAGSGSGGCLDITEQDVTDPETDVVVAAVAGGTVTATVRIQGCRGPNLGIRHNKTDLLGLTGASQLDAALLSTLGLPPAG